MIPLPMSIINNNTFQETTQYFKNNKINEKSHHRHGSSSCFHHLPFKKVDTITTNNDLAGTVDDPQLKNLIINILLKQKHIFYFNASLVYNFNYFIVASSVHGAGNVLNKIQEKMYHNMKRKYSTKNLQRLAVETENYLFHLNRCEETLGNM